MQKRKFSKKSLCCIQLHFFVLNGHGFISLEIRFRDLKSISHHNVRKIAQNRFQFKYWVLSVYLITYFMKLSRRSVWQKKSAAILMSQDFNYQPGIFFDEQPIINLRLKSRLQTTVSREIYPTTCFQEGHFRMRTSIICNRTQHKPGRPNLQ